MSGLIKNSFYWVRYTQHGRWEPAFLNNLGKWKAIGFTGDANVFEVCEFIKKFE